jgi:cell volume regulation protein A
MPEITDYALILLVVSGGVALSLGATQITARTGVPAAAFLLVAGALASDISSPLANAMSVETVERIAVVALIVVLFDGGMDIGAGRFLANARPILALGVFATFITAGLLALVAHWVLGLSWITSSLLGAALAPTDPAVTFSVLRKSSPGRSRTILEGEAGVNDPAGIALMLGVIEVATHPDASAWAGVREFIVSMGLGGIAGVLAGPALVAVFRRWELDSVGLYPVMALSAAGLLYGATTAVGGSGFLAVFLAGLFVGDAALTRETGIKQFHSALASMAEVVVFVALGLSLHLSGVSASVWTQGLVLAAALALLARPLAVALCLYRSPLDRAERFFISWSGLKGAVPILLAAFAVIASAENAGAVYETVFVVVLVSVAVQGSLVAAVGRRVGVLK